VSSVLVGLLVFAYLGGPPHVEPGYARDRPARARTSAREHSPAWAGGRSPQGERVWASPARRYVPVGRLEIPAIGVRAPFFIGVHDDVVRYGPGLWPGTPLPGGAGNAVLAGHRTTHTRPFADLDRLAPGDVVRASVGGGRTTEFRVVETTIVPEATYVEHVLRPSAGGRAATITLFACTPKGERTHRIVVRARSVGA